MFGNLFAGKDVETQIQYKIYETGIIITWYIYDKWEWILFFRFTLRL